MLDELFDEDALREAYNKAKAKKEYEEGLKVGRKEERADLLNKLIKAGFSEEQLNNALNANG